MCLVLRSCMKPDACLPQHRTPLHPPRTPPYPAGSLPRPPRGSHGAMSSQHCFVSTVLKFRQTESRRVSSSGSGCIRWALHLLRFIHALGRLRGAPLVKQVKQRGLLVSVQVVMSEVVRWSPASSPALSLESAWGSLSLSLCPPPPHK